MSVTDLSRYLGGLRRRGLGGRSIARHLSAVRGLYRFLLDERRITRDPTEHLDSPRPARRLPRTLSVEDAAALVEAPDTTRPDGLRDRALLELLYACGLRASEALGLRVEDVNFAAGYVDRDREGEPAAPRPGGRAGARVGAALLAHGAAAARAARRARRSSSIARAAACRGRRSGG